MGLAVFVGAIGLVGVLAKDCRFRNAQLALGQWIAEGFGPSARLAGPDGAAQVIAHYANAACRSFAQTAPRDAIVAVVRQFRPEVVLLQPTSRMKPDRCAEIVDAIAHLGWQRTDPARLPLGCEGVVVLERIQGGVPCASAW